MADQTNNCAHDFLGVTVDSVSELLSVGAKGYQKRELVIVDESNPQYPQHVKIEFGGEEKAAKLSKINPGDIVDVFTNIQGRKWKNAEGKETVFNSFAGWKIKTVSAATAPVDMAETPTYELPVDTDDDSAELAF